MDNYRESVLRIENGSFAYKGGRRVLRNINIDIGAGEVLAVLGPNGAGKTTMLRCMMDMLRWDSGQSMLYGEDIHGMPAKKLWSRMAYVPQARSAASSYTAFQTVLLGRSSRIGVFASPSDRDMEIAERVMKQLGIYELADKPCYAISGGELQMVLIARAMAAEPRLLILDEPESNLDFRNQLVVLDAISALASDGVACVFNTHYPAHALQRAGKSLILTRDGRSRFGSTMSVVTEENIREAFGVNAVIGEVETAENILRNVVPVSISSASQRESSPRVDHDGSSGASGSCVDQNGSEECIASITLIFDSNEYADRINRLMHEYEHLLIGRMGMPYRKRGLHIINANVDGRREEIEELTHRMGLIPGISVKTTYAR
ncbi:MAG: ATP-binding cassette domain-containing protein [Mogibacterium sp.]|nr:ATP-binding cassette domain-containing protein [Mogibacterium sp.]